MFAAAYFQHYPLMSRDPGGELDGNSVLYAGTYALICRKLYGRYVDAKDYEYNLYKFIEVKPGVICRGGKPQDPQTHDDYIGLCTLSGLTAEKKAATEVYEYGKANCWSYVNVAYSFKDLFNAQFWRLPGVVQHIKICAGKSWSWFDYLLFIVSVLTNAFTAKNSTSGKILTWHMVTMYELLGDRFWLADKAVAFWKHRILKMYPNAMGDVFGIYFGKDHVFAKYTIGII
mgnify:CR=1 FL=1